MVVDKYLIADVGATNARFRLLTGNEAQSAVLVVESAAHETAKELVLSAKKSLGFDEISGALLAVAGPVDQGLGTAVVTNTGHRFDVEELTAELHCPVWLENDFVALAHGIPGFTDLVQVGGKARAKGVKAIVGVGSGFGMAAVVPQGQSFQVLSSEGGHADFAPASHLDNELWTMLMADTDHVSLETVLSGPGIVRLYECICRVWGVKHSNYNPERISALGVSMEDPICHQTLETFFGILGSAAGNVALTFGARGGIYIGGGIVPRFSDYVIASPLRRRFEEKGLLSAFVKDIPIWVINDSHPGLLGARCCLFNRLA